MYQPPLGVGAFARGPQGFVDDPHAGGNPEDRLGLPGAQRAAERPERARGHRDVLLGFDAPARPALGRRPRPAGPEGKRQRVFTRPGPEADPALAHLDRSRAGIGPALLFEERSGRGPAHLEARGVVRDRVEAAEMLGVGLAVFPPGAWF